VSDPVPQAGVIAPVIARLDRLETAHRLLAELVDRLMADVVGLGDVRGEIEGELRELRAAIRRRS
jgi:hypothetical protein